jgi:hypothetical protein
LKSYKVTRLLHVDIAVFMSRIALSTRNNLVTL